MAAITRRVPGGRAAAVVPVLAAGAVVIGVIARFVTRSPLWLDEALSVNIAQLPLRDIPEALRHDGHPPLYYFLLHGWTELFGTSDIAVRALSGVLSVATLPLAWLVGRRVGGRVAAGWTIVLVALSPYAVRYGTEARMYSLVMLGVLAGVVLVRDELDADVASARWRLVALGCLSGALLLTHYWSFWLLVAVVIVLAPRVRSGDDAARRVLIAVVAGTVALVPWFPSLLDQLRHTGTPWGGRVRPTSALAVTLDDLGGGDFGEAALLGTVVAVLVVLGVFAVAGAGAQSPVLDVRGRSPVRGEAAVAVATLAIGSVVGWIADSTYASRYASVVVPLVLVVAARGIAVLPTAASFVAGAVVIGLSLAGIGSNVVEARTQADVIADAIESEARPGDVVAFCPDQLGPAVDRALDVDVARVTYPAFASPERVDWVDYEERVDAGDPVAFARELDRRADDRVVWLVSSGAYRTHGDVCARIGDELRRQRHRARLIVAEDPDEYFEHASLAVYGSSS